MNITHEQLAALPLHLDGSDGSMWPARSTMTDVIANPGLEGRLFIRLSDLLELLQADDKDRADFARLYGEPTS